MSRLALALVLAAGCGPYGYVTTVTMHASTSVAEAEKAEAEKYAPYWFTRAREYLHKAREEAAHANFGAANRFGRLAAEAASHAVADAERRKANPALMDEITRPVVSPTRGGNGMAPIEDDEPEPAPKPKRPDGGLAPIEDDEAPPGLEDPR